MNHELRTALIGMTILAVALGIGRFVLTPLLPLMQADHGLTLVGGGWLASTNMLGYLLGALLCALRPLPPRFSLCAGAIGVSLATLGMGLTTHLGLWLVWRFVAGVASAALVVHGIAWSMGRLRAAGRPLLEHVMFSGTGVGIFGSGLLVAASHPFGASAAGLWITFGIVTVALFAWMWRRMGDDEAAIAGSTSILSRETLPSGPAWTLVLMYGLLGFAYTIPAAFLPLIAERQLHLPALREWFWPLFGVAMTVSTLALRWLPARTDNRTVLAASSVSLSSGMLVSVGGDSISALTVATLLIGSAIMPVVMYTMREARLLAPRNSVRLIAALTTTLGVGQAAGPAFAAWLAARTGAFDLPLMAGAIVSAVAMACTLVRRPLRNIDLDPIARTSPEHQASRQRSVPIITSQPNQRVYQWNTAILENPDSRSRCSASERAPSAAKGRCSQRGAGPTSPRHVA